MSNLKTLKDIEHEFARKFDSIGFNIKCSCGRRRVPIILSAIDLRREAIKRIKYLEKINKEKSKFARHEFIEGRIHEIKEFFNIPWKELKDGHI